MLEGEISEINLVERLVDLWREEFTGAIRFENDGIIKIVYFKSGDVLSASTNDRADSIDEILMRAGKVSREHVKQALAKRKENETLGDALLNLGFITRKELTWARRVQVVGVIRSIAAWAQGSFTIVADYLPKRDEGTLFPLPQILIELIVTDQDRQKVERVLEGGNAVLSKTSDFDGVFRRLGLNEDADAIVAEIDGERNASEVAVTSGKDTFNVYKLLHALETLRILTRNANPQEPSQVSMEDFAAAGVSDAADMWSEPPTPSLPTLELDIASNSAQQIQFDSEPEVPGWDVAPSAPAAVAPVASAWDDEPAFDAPAPAAPPVETPARMPAWDAPVRPAAVVPPPASIEPPADADEEQWGFDEAQIETAARATAVPPIPPPAPSVVASAQRMRRGKAEGGNRRFALLITIFVIAIVGAAGYYGFLWYQNRQDEAAEATVAASTPAPRPAPPAATPAPTATIVEAATPAVTETTVTTTSATTPVTTAPAPAAAVPAPAVTAPTPAQALPAVVRRTDASSNRYEAMAREYAANATGNFTVQIQILCETSNLDKALRDGGGEVWFVPQPIKGRPCYRVFWGRYATREAAQSALAGIPASLKDRNSAVKPVPKP